MVQKYYIDPDIKKASTLPASFYRDPQVFGLLKDKVFRTAWNFIQPELLPGEGVRAVPFTLLEGYLDIPLLLTKTDRDALHCLSNVCTHRGNLLLQQRSNNRKLVCGYHGRRFSMQGRFEFMPEFEKADGFPLPCDDLPRFPLVSWGPLWFMSTAPSNSFEGIRGWMEERIGFLPLGNFRPAYDRSQTYEVKAHWALYCDNYLEGFHIPFVHKSLDAVLDYGQYDTLLSKYGTLQIGYADSKTTEVFNLPEGHPDEGKQVAAYYYWVFPNLMFNFYPWGLSLNVVCPVSRETTKVQFYSYVMDASKLDTGAGSGLDRVEMEDEAVVEGVQRGLQSPYYNQGRFSPTRETGVHHFHRMLAEALSTNN